MLDSGTIRTDTNDVPYLKDTPNDKVVHVAYQNFSVSDIGSKYTTLYATEEKHMVSGINKLLMTRYQWDDLVGKTIEFFCPENDTPFINLIFEKVGGYYIATVVSSDVTWEVGKKPDSDVYTTLEESLETNNIVYHGKQSDGSDLELIKFTKLSYTTHPLSSKATRQEDFTLLLVSDDKLVTTRLNTYPLGVSDMYTVLEFDKESIPVIELIVDVPTRSSLAKAISHATGLKVTPEHFITNDLVRFFDPMKSEYTNEKLTIHTLHAGDKVKFVLAGFRIIGE